MCTSVKSTLVKIALLVMTSSTMIVICIVVIKTVDHRRYQCTWQRLLPHSNCAWILSTIRDLKKDGSTFVQSSLDQDGRTWVTVKSVGTSAHKLVKKSGAFCLLRRLGLVSMIVSSVFLMTEARQSALVLGLCCKICSWAMSVCTMYKNLLAWLYD